MIQRHLFDAGNVIEYDSDDWRNCPCKKFTTLILTLTMLATRVLVLRATLFLQTEKKWSGLQDYKSTVKRFVHILLETVSFTSKIVCTVLRNF